MKTLQAPIDSLDALDNAFDNELYNRVRTITRRSHRRANRQSQFRDVLDENGNRHFGDANVPDTSRHGLPAHEQLAREELIKRCRASLEADGQGTRCLSDDERRVLRCRYLEGLTLRETSEKLGLSIGQVAYRERKAREKLRYRFARDCESV